MADTFSFDVVSDFERQEIVNVVDQTLREVRTRYDLKDSKTDIDLEEKKITINTDSEYHLTAIKDLLQGKAVKRSLSLKIFKFGKAEPASGGRVRQVVDLQKGLSEDLAKSLVKEIKSNFPKVQSQIQGDALRITAKSKDDLQRVIQHLRGKADDLPVALQFTNYR
ncbi:MAG TPA: YajQ family cyclic di-GMP-binding protein [Chloroflexia bacterium]|nr:YajQ family cyclic di-GMP-binding protein [Chloroflexia bacterium]